MFDFDKEGSNMPPSIHIMLVKWFFLTFRRNPMVSIEMKALKMDCKKE